MLQNPLTIQRLYDDNRESLQLGWFAGFPGGERTISGDAASAADQVGHLNTIHPGRIQVFGHQEINYYHRLKALTRAHVIGELIAGGPPALIIAAMYIWRFIHGSDRRKSLIVGLAAATFAVMALLVGAVAVLVLTLLVIPLPNSGEVARSGYVVAAGVYVVVAVTIGVVVGVRGQAPLTNWLSSGGPPTPALRSAVLRTPHRVPSVAGGGSAVLRTLHRATSMAGARSAAGHNQISSSDTRSSWVKSGAMVSSSPTRESDILPGSRTPDAGCSQPGWRTMFR